ncbi:phosphate regulon sensor histidine kinase PhoR [Gilvimarinus sp. SDUM040013]|uniref:Phosphate regulon sensor protein PhoR n=1 Tax=Gilvimarinus gilvus TaxID=3058038 RepID=A0ABU4RXZ2_9GAMM|nr:phosphate regulon sensor histidine kinase PhoR [Gilvimarinus sp. SDUM040013]MDO3388634.1 phosphate regulon sensor histidine kinase PhoR [Gilvimarinus sp. SDUM040013]MDX6849529.1 phosphate regulon sensor histidine kinase PhoR [Gilvimarinus sp. SDUM040013]
MFQGFNTEVKRLIVATAIAGIIGLLVDQLAWALLLTAAWYIGWNLWQMLRLSIWLQGKRKAQPPESTGLWGEVFDAIYHLQRRQKREKKNLQAVINRVQETTSALKDGVILLDWRGYLDWWNPAAQRLLGFYNSDQGQSVLNFIRHPRFVEYFEQDDYAEPLDIPSSRFPDKRLQFQITRFGKNERLIVVRDITQIFHLEQMRKDFVANVSHELRTPLTVISGYLETMADNNSTPAWDKPLVQMQQQSKRMSLLINDLITLSKLETADTGFNQKRMPLEPLLQSIRAEAMVLATDKEQTITLDASADITVVGNEKELHSAFSNLVINAVKYTPEQGKIAMRLWRSGPSVYFSVTDNGAGFETKHIPHLTERFYRVDASRNSKTGGTGLGLAIVKHVLLRHDAELQIHSEVGKGSVFTCVLPANDGRTGLRPNDK